MYGIRFALLPPTEPMDYTDLADTYGLRRTEWAPANLCGPEELDRRIILREADDTVYAAFLALRRTDYVGSRWDYYFDDSCPTERAAWKEFKRILEDVEGRIKTWKASRADKRAAYKEAQHTTKLFSKAATAVKVTPVVPVPDVMNGFNTYMIWLNRGKKPLPQSQKQQKQKPKRSRISAPIDLDSRKVRLTK